MAVIMRYLWTTLFNSVTILVIVLYKKGRGSRMYRLIQVKLGQFLLRKSRGELTDRQFSAFINGANTALASVGVFYAANTSEILLGSTEMSADNYSIDEEMYFKNGFQLVLEQLDALGEDTEALHEKYSNLV